MAYTRSTELRAAVIIARCISMTLSSHHASRIQNNLRLHANPLISIHFRSAIRFNLVFISQFSCIIIWEWNTRALGFLVLLAIIPPRADPVYRHVTVWSTFLVPYTYARDKCGACYTAENDVFDRHLQADDGGKHVLVVPR
jgi:hypothetical protein